MDIGSGPNVATKKHYVVTVELQIGSVRFVVIENIIISVQNKWAD